MSASKRPKETRFKSKSTPYIDDETISLLDKLLSQHKLRIFTYFGRNVPKQSPAK